MREQRKKTIVVTGREMRLIDADALIERLEPYKDKYGAKEFPYYMVHEAFIYEMGKEPAVDAVPVIRCVDCKYSEHWYREKRRCFLWSESGIDVFNDGYCNYGQTKAERKDDETD